MADVKISALPAVPVAVATTDLFAIVQGGVTYKATLTEVVTAITSTGLTATAGVLTVNLSTGVTGGQSVIGGTAASNNLTLSSTSNATKGKILFGTSAYDEVNNRLGIGTQSPAYRAEFVSSTGSATAGVLVKNTGSGSSDFASYNLITDTTVQGQLFLSSSGYNFVPLVGASGLGLYNNSVSGITIWAGDASGVIKFQTGIATTSGSQRMTIFSDGNVSINTGNTNAGFRLDVNGTARIQERLTVSQDNTVATQVVSVIDTDTANCSIVIAPTGTGALIADIPNGAATGGNQRGLQAVDLQLSRNNAAQVASGNNSGILSGFNNTASNEASGILCGSINTASGISSAVLNGSSNTAIGTASSVLCGTGNIASSTNSIASGNNSVAYLEAQRAHASGIFVNKSDAQNSIITSFRSITGTVTTELFINGTSGRFILGFPASGPTNARAWRAQIDVVAIVQTVGNGTVTLGDCFMGSYHVGIKRIGTATSLVGTVAVTNEVNDAGMAGAAVTITADDTNEALKIEFTPATNAGTTTVTRVVATAYLTEVGY